MNVVGVAENVVVQHGGVRALHGWLDGALQYKYICLFRGEYHLLLRIIYHYDRNQVITDVPSARGFLGEVVYGAGAVVAQIIRPESEATGVVLLESMEPVGFVTCNPPVNAVMEQGRRRLQIPPGSGDGPTEASTS